MSRDDYAKAVRMYVIESARALSFGVCAGVHNLELGVGALAIVASEAGCVVNPVSGSPRRATGCEKRNSSGERPKSAWLEGAYHSRVRFLRLVALSALFASAVAANHSKAQRPDAGHLPAATRCDPLDPNDAVRWPSYPQAEHRSKLDALLNAGLGDSRIAEPQRGSVGIERVAETDDGRMLVVLRSPWSNAPFNAVRVFFGPQHVLEQRQLRDFQTARDGGSTLMKFKVGDAEAAATFDVCRGTDGRQTRQSCPATLTVSAAEHPLQQLPPERDALRDARFLCRR